MSKPLILAGHPDWLHHGRRRYAQSSTYTLTGDDLCPGFFKGTSADQDRRFSDKELKLLKTMKFPPEFDKKVRMSHVYLDGAPNVYL